MVLFCNEKTESQDGKNSQSPSATEFMGKQRLVTIDTDESICRAAIEIQTQRLVNTAGEGGGGRNRESSMETYTLPYVK